MTDPDIRPPKRHPRPPIYYVTPTGWRARCSACGWEQGCYHDHSDAIGGFLEHAELEHGIVTQDRTVMYEDGTIEHQETDHP